MANKASDVPSAIANELTQRRQMSAIGNLLSTRPGALNSAAPIFGDGSAPTNKDVEARLASSGGQCLWVMVMTSVTFEHAKDYKSRNALAVVSSLAEYRRGKKKPVIQVNDDTRTPIANFPVKVEADLPVLQAELGRAYTASADSLLDRFDKKRR